MKKMNSVVAVMLLSLLVFSCKKPGCTDPIATNYDIKAKSDNINCTYEGQVGFWYNEAAGKKLKALGGDSLKFFMYENYIDSSKVIYVDSLSVIDFLDEAPECGASDVATYTSAFGKSDFRFVQYRIFNELDLLLYDSIVKLTADECLMIQLR